VSIWFTDGQMFGRNCSSEEADIESGGRCLYLLCPVGYMVKCKISSLPLSCRQICTEALPIYQTKVFEVSRSLFMRIYRNLAPSLQYGGGFQIQPIARLHLRIGYDKGDTHAEVEQRRKCLDALVENLIGQKEVCIISYPTWAAPNNLRFPRLASTNSTLGRLRGLKKFESRIEKQSSNGDAADFKRRLALMEVSHEFAYLAKDLDTGVLDDASRWMAESGKKFYRGFQIKNSMKYLRRYRGYRIERMSKSSGRQLPWHS
jgi:hypothetical protein